MAIGTQHGRRFGQWRHAAKYRAVWSVCQIISPSASQPARQLRSGERCSNLVFNRREARSPAPREVYLVRWLGLLCAPSIGLPDRCTLHGCETLGRRLHLHERNPGTMGEDVEGRNTAWACACRGSTESSRPPQKKGELDDEMLLLELLDELLDELEEEPRRGFCGLDDAREDFGLATH